VRAETDKIRVKRLTYMALSKTKIKMMRIKKTTDRENTPLEKSLTSIPLTSLYGSFPAFWPERMIRHHASGLPGNAVGSMEFSLLVSLGGELIY
jgi:hypothetical protein